MEIISYFYKGGDIMWIILAGLIIELALIAERSVFYFFNSYPYEKYEKHLRDSLKINSLKNISAQKSYKETKSFWERLFQKIDRFRLENSVIFGISSVYLNTLNDPEEARLAAMKRKSGTLLHLQERGLRMLSLIGQIAPLLGLLGTVTGMIKAFFVIASLGGAVDVTKLAGGISEAMITTAFGLIVAVPAYIFHDFFNYIIENRVEKINRMVHLLDEYYHKEKSGKNLELHEK